MPKLPQINLALAPQLLCLLALSLFSGIAHSAVRDDVGYSRLVTELGHALPSGEGVKVFQIEAAVGESWLPNLKGREFSGKTISGQNARSPGVFSGHATSVARRYYGKRSSFSPAVSDISAYNTETWFHDLYNLGSPFGAYPEPTDRQVANHSWVGSGFVDATGNFSARITSDIFRLSDWFSATDEVVQVFGAANNDNYPADNSKVLMASSFNGIAAGVSDHSHGYRVVPLDDIYQANRVAIHLVVPHAATSYAAADIASAATFLIDAAKQNASWSESWTRNRNGDVILNAERSEVVKAALLAGAQRRTQNSSRKGDILDYRQKSLHRTSNGMDWRYGAGQLNVYNSFQILASGESASIQDGGADNIGFHGFDHDESFGGAEGSNELAVYDLGIAQEQSAIVASLVWNLEVSGALNPDQRFDTNATLHNLDLELVELGYGVVMKSSSTRDNTENIWAMIEPGKHYQLRVTRPPSASPFVWDYAIAWRLDNPVVPVPIPMLPPGALLLLLLAIGVIAEFSIKRRAYG